MLSVFKSQILYEAFSDLPYKVPNFSNVCKAGEFLLMFLLTLPAPERRGINLVLPTFLHFNSSYLLGILCCVMDMQTVV